MGDDGEIDRKVLGSKVFGSPESLTKLTDIVWPAIKNMAQQEIRSVRAEQPKRVIVLEAAVLFEAGWEDIVDEVWSTLVDREVAIERATNRDGSDREQVEARIDAQLTNEERAEKADRLIENSDSEEDLAEKVRTLWKGISE